jgi:hypothetical protein
VVCPLTDLNILPGNTEIFNKDVIYPDSFGFKVSWFLWPVRGQAMGEEDDWLTFNALGSYGFLVNLFLFSKNEIAGKNNFLHNGFQGL